MDKKFKEIESKLDPYRITFVNNNLPQISGILLNNFNMDYNINYTNYLFSNIGDILSNSINVTGFNNIINTLIKTNMYYTTRTIENFDYTRYNFQVLFIDNFFNTKLKNVIDFNNKVMLPKYNFGGIGLPIFLENYLINLAKNPSEILNFYDNYINSFINVSIGNLAYIKNLIIDNLNFEYSKILKNDREPNFIIVSYNMSSIIIKDYFEANSDLNV